MCEKINLFMVSLKVKHKSKYSDNRFGGFSFIDMIMKTLSKWRKQFLERGAEAQITYVLWVAIVSFCPRDQILEDSSF